MINENYELLSTYVEQNDYEGLLDAIAKRLRSLKSDTIDDKTSLMIRILSQFGMFLLNIQESPFHEKHIRDEAFKMAQKIDGIYDKSVDIKTSFIKIMAKISNWEFKTAFAHRRGFTQIDDINAYLDEN